MCTYLLYLYEILIKKRFSNQQNINIKQYYIIRLIQDKTLDNLLYPLDNAQIFFQVKLYMTPINQKRILFFVLIISTTF